MKRKRVRIGPDGSLRAVYSDDAREMLQRLGEVQLRRASRVDPGSELSATAREWLAAHSLVVIPSAWYAEMLVGSKQVLGPFDSYGEAVLAEQQVLEQERFPLL